jgi:PAS domain S-box-containing protein
VSPANQALWFNAVPLLVIAAAYLAAAALLGSSLWRERRRASRLDLAVWLVFAAVGVAAGTYGAVLAAEREAPVGGIWLTLGIAAVVGLPAFLALASAGRRGAATEPTTLESSALHVMDDAERATRELLEAVERHLDAELACLMLVDDQARQATGLVGRVRRNDLDWFPDARIDLDNEPSGVATAAYEGTPFAVYDAKASKVVSQRFVEATGAKSVAFVPLIADERVIAVLVVGSVSQPRAFRTDEFRLLETLAAETALALDRTRSTVALAEALDRERQQARVQRGFFRIAAALGQSLSRSATLEALALAATEALGGAFAAVLMPRGPNFELAASARLPADVARALAAGLLEGAECLGTAAADGRVLASRDVAGDDRFEQPWQQLAGAEFRALLAVPVASPRAERAGLVIVFFDEERVFTDEDLELTRHLGDAGRGALERSELFEAERTARALSQQLARTGGVLATELDPAAVLDEVVQQAPVLLGGDACAVRTLEDEELVVSAAFGKGAEDAVGTRAASTGWLSGDVFQSRSPLAIEDATTDERLIEADPILAGGYGAYLGVPLSGPEGAPAGVLAVYARSPRRWRPEEIEALQALAANTSAALANAELYSRVSLEKERSVAILANIADGIVAVDRDGNVVLWNAAAEEITGVPQEEAIGRTTTQVLQRQLESGIDETHSGQRLVSVMRGGEELWLSLSEAVMRDPLGAVAGRIFAFRDISADRMVEQIKSDFVAAVSHELRTPLTSIYGFAETLLRQDIPFGEEERRTFLGYIASESQRLTEIVDQLLNVARLDAGDLQVEVAPIDLGSVVSEVVETVEESGAMNGHRFEIDLPEEPLAAEADRDKVRQVFNILVENALRYSPRGGTVTVGARRNADRVEVRVVDEGIGIPPAERDRIFRKFYRAESTARDGAAGTGLGLFIARELVTAMGGRIWVDSTEGKGSSFAFELPAARE